MPAYDDHLESVEARLDREDAANEEVMEDNEFMDALFARFAAPYADLFANPAKTLEAIWNGTFLGIERDVRAEVQKEVDRRQSEKLLARACRTQPSYDHAA